ncbi:MAG: alpha/beta hydrolase [Terricaulis sp.]
MSYWTLLLGHPFKVEHIDVKGLSTRAMTMGNPAGEAVIFLHGMSGHLEAFVPVAPHLASDFDLHLIDMLGHGFTAKPDEPLVMTNLANHLIGYMDARGIAKAHLVGISLGGWLAGWMAAKHGDRCLSATLIAAAGNPAMGKPEIGERVRKITLDGVMSDDRRDTYNRVRAVVFSDAGADDEIVDTRYAVYHQPEFRANVENMLALTDNAIYNANRLTPEMLHGVTCEVLLCWGEDDRNSGVADAAFLSDHLPKSKLVQMARTGHWPPYERPFDFANIARAFFKDGLNAVTAGRHQ